MTIDLPDARTLSEAVKEALRFRAIHAIELGYNETEVARILGLRRETVCRWYSLYRQQGQEGLLSQPTGRPLGVGRALSSEEEQLIQDLIDQHSPEEIGVASALWTRQAIQELIQQECQTLLAIRTVGDYLKRWGYTPQRPKRRSYKQQPQEVQTWLETTYPKIKARAKREGAEIHWGDETGIRSTCHVGRGYAKPGQTPELKVQGSRFSVNMISSITNQGKLRFMTYMGRMTAVRFLQFLNRLIQGADSKIFLVLDNLSLHQAKLVKAFETEHQTEIELFFIPKYSPELNPDEYLNCDVKTEIHKKGLSRTRSELKEKLIRTMRKLTKLPNRIASYFRHRSIRYAS